MPAAPWRSYAHKQSSPRCLREAPAMPAPREMHLVAYLKTGPTAMHVGAWRHPDATLDDILEPSRYEHIARVLEAGKFDACFFADLFGLYDIHKGGFDTY